MNKKEKRKHNTQCYTIISKESQNLKVRSWTLFFHEEDKFLTMDVVLIITVQEKKKITYQRVGIKNVTMLESPPFIAFQKDYISPYKQQGKKIIRIKKKHTLNKNLQQAAIPKNPEKR